jgi:hypothetical protein
MVLDWYTVTMEALQNLWQAFLNFVPALLGAIIIFVIGWFVSVGIGKLVTEILKRIRFNQIFQKGNWDEALAKADIKVDAAGFIGAIVKWVLVIVFLLAAVEVLGLTKFADFLNGVLAYLPNVIVAALIFVVTVIVVDILEKIIRVTVESIKVGYGQLVSAVIKWSVWVFAVLAILDQLKFTAADWVIEFVQIIAIGVVAMFAIAFGLGGKEAAAEILQDVRKKFKE